MADQITVTLDGEDLARLELIRDHDGNDLSPNDQALLTRLIDVVADAESPTPYDPALKCCCGHTAHWHGQEIDAPQGSGECEFSADCGCKRFLLSEPPSGVIAAKTDLSAIVASAKEMHAANRTEQLKAGQTGLTAWTYLPDWMKLSWFCEAAAELGMEL